MKVYGRPGIIPADAGSTIWHLRDEDYYADHPRGCGEHVVLGAKVAFHAGSSPRMRGALHRILVVPDLDRIIPADAGSTHQSLYGCVGPLNHPRGCGEHGEINGLNRHTQGSSPRMRGARTANPGILI